MDQDTARQTFDKWLQAWNSDDADWVRTFYQENAVLYQAPEKRSAVGREFVIGWWRILKQAAPDTRTTINALHVSGDTVVLEVNMKGTHSGEFLGYQPSGGVMDVDTCLAFIMEDERIAQHTTYLDVATMLRAFGLISVPPAEAQAA
ncbi:MAG: hypothetical protein C4521_07825 [Actinobacteria bacterium]|nr:MAG: hypothetical protein C4521_07825 [Actinomycetota bacterium]